MEEEMKEIAFEIKRKENLELKVEEEEDEGPQQQQKKVGDEHVLQFLDSVDNYLTLFDSLSSMLRQVMDTTGIGDLRIFSSKFNVILLQLLLGFSFSCLK